MHAHSELGELEADQESLHNTVTVRGTAPFLDYTVIAAVALWVVLLVTTLVVDRILLVLVVLLLALPIVFVVAYRYRSYARGWVIAETTVTTNGVIFVRKRGDKILAKWDDLSPKNRPLDRGSFLFKWCPDPPGEGAALPKGGTIPVTRAQALAIISHPSAPKWNLPSELKSKRGIK